MKVLAILMWIIFVLSVAFVMAVGYLPDKLSYTCQSNLLTILAIFSFSFGFLTITTILEKK